MNFVSGKGIKEGGKIYVLGRDIDLPAAHIGLLVLSRLNVKKAKLSVFRLREDAVSEKIKEVRFKIRNLDYR